MDCILPMPVLAYGDICAIDVNRNLNFRIILKMAELIKIIHLMLLGMFLIFKPSKAIINGKKFISY